MAHSPLHLEKPILVAIDLYPPAEPRGQVGIEGSTPAQLEGHQLLTKRPRGPLHTVRGHIRQAADVERAEQRALHQRRQPVVSNTSGTAEVDLAHARAS